MSTGNNLYKDRNFIAVIGDEVIILHQLRNCQVGLPTILYFQDTVTGLLLAGVGHIDSRQKSNFLVVDSKTTLATIEEAFLEYTRRKDVAIVLINQHVAEDIRELIDSHDQAFPAVLEIPSKDQPYDPAKDSVLKRVQRLFGE
ncbi:F subunit of V-type ATPase [Basidiobolus meristosporus CBS 931.73]|uniref:V-type proton ATPase subunit F n=1 Tax=Basidiobolus meristosporus CBS 931.73 TaxID=1314790 RepID=A0A1Y1ZDU1_9FUNG|nr:F subunit of V-type ATPase [Basidiobolus meristosporus CBS 931.73]|eukprot:ORY08137.1 F subunit of V-type ATPase [Basidiobolus meristosporus CBS 931.73]